MEDDDFEAPRPSLLKIPSQPPPPSPSKLKVVTCVETVMEKPIHIQLILMTDSALIWVGDAASFQNLDVAMVLGNGNVASSSLMGHSLDATGGQIAARLVKRVGQQVFVSWNVSADPAVQVHLVSRISCDSHAVLRLNSIERLVYSLCFNQAAVERRIIEELKTNNYWRPVKK